MQLRQKNLCLGMVFLFVLCFSVQGYGAEENGSVLAKKTLTRLVDPVIVAGSLAKELTNVSLSNLRLYTFKDGTFKPIRYQIDEMTGDNGDWIFPSGKIPSIEFSNGKFDTWDTIIFMAEDTGDKVSPQAWTPGNTRGAEIEVIDPLTGGKGWVYMLYFASNPPAPSSEPKYINYDYANEKIWSDYWGMTQVITEDGRHIPCYKSVWITKEGGGSGENFVDRFKVRVTLKAFFKAVTVRATENTMKSDTMTYTSGPIRAMRRYEAYVYIPGGFKAFRVVTDVTYYRDIITSPYVVNVPIKMGTVLSSAVLKMGTDYNPSIIGKATLYNSNNPQGAPVTGHMDDSKTKNWNPERDDWRLITGDFGTYMARAIMPADAMKHVQITMGIIDDITKKDPPEYYPGTIGFLYQDWELKDLPRGKYIPFLEWYYPKQFKPKVIEQYTNMTDNLLKVRCGDQEGVSKLLYAPNLGEKYKSIREKKIKETK